MKTHNLLSLVFMVMAVHAGVPISRTVDVSATIKPISIESYAGETLDLSVQLSSGGAPLATPSASATIYWQTNGMANAWWQTNMSCSASGLVTGSWSPGLPSGRVWFFVGVESSGLNYRIAGQCAIMPSPGGAPSTAVLPPPGGTLNLGDYTIIGAPWITSSDSAAAISSAISPLSIAIASISERAASAATSASNYTDSVAAPLIAATNSITERLDAIDIPDVSGFASKTSLQASSNSLAEAVQQLSSDLTSATNELHTSLAPTISAASTALQPSATNSLLTSLAPTIQLASTALQPAASNALAQAISALAQTVAYNAQQSGYDLVAVSNALAEAIAALSQTVDYNAQQAGYDLSSASNALAQATAALSQTVADNAQQVSSDLTSATNSLHTSFAPTVQLASTALQPSATNGIPEEIISATNALNQSLAPTISSTSNALAQATADLAQKVEGLAISTSASNTAFRLMSLDGQIYQDATGTVWHTATAIGTSDWYSVSIQYTNGTTVATNEIPGIPSWSIDGSWQETEGVEYWIWTLRVPAGGSEYASSGGIAEDDSPSDMSLQFPLGSGDIAYLDFARTNTVSHYWSPSDRVLYASSSGSDGGLTTNDVLLSPVYSDAAEWSWSPSSYNGNAIYLHLEGNRFTPMANGQTLGIDMPVADTVIWTAEYAWYGDVDLVATRTDIIGYTLGTQTNKVLAATNALISASITNGLVTASITNDLPNIYQLKLPYATNSIPVSAVSNALSITEAEAGFTEWTYTGLPVGAVVPEDGKPSYNGEVWSFYFDYNGTSFFNASEIGSEDSTNITFLCYDVDYEQDPITVTATRIRLPTMADLAEISTSGTNYTDAATNSLHTSLTPTISSVAQSATNYTDSATNSLNQSIAPTVSAAIAAVDTSYPRVIGITNINQTVQFVAIDSAVPTTLSIMLPTSGDTKDWIVYVTSQTNVTINLPASTWWLADTSATNDIAPQTPTALYFSQAADGIYTLGRQEFTEVVLP